MMKLYCPSWTISNTWTEKNLYTIIVKQMGAVTVQQKIKKEINVCVWGGGIPKVQPMKGVNDCFGGVGYPNLKSGGR